MQRWQNKVAVVTGASAGIGVACSRALLEKGMIVVGLARRQERMEKEFKPTLPKEQQSRFHAVKCDVSKEADILRAFAWIEEKLGGIDVLVNNAGLYRVTEITAENNSDDLRSTVDTNIMGVAFCTREAFRSMKKRGFDGHVVLVNSIAGHKVPNVPHLSVNIYSPTKFAVTAMTEVFRQEFLRAGTKIKVSSVSPGAVNTDMASTAIDDNYEVPMLKPEDVADAIVYCIQTPPHVQIHELTVKVIGEMNE